ncbi:MAG: tRNA glutamyl-Q(34) synthetase GluQRS [Betaproteobacteria bacterium]|nr:tRNA glutamyl-Q(34) synthetase GluQRS [Betaproteobacteria bacterium]
MSSLKLSAYRGRFAPSPSGPLHFGSLVAAVGSFLEAHRHQGQWLVRMEDVDQPRTVPGAADAILRTLEAYGFAWEGPVLYQSQRLEAYAEALARLKASGDAYSCACSRKEISDSGSGRSIDGAPLYPGTCRHGLAPGRLPRAWRLRVPEREVVFVDLVQGPVRQNLAREVGDFVLLRADGQYAYQLAVVVDDAAQGVTQVVRGADLLDSTARQIWLQECLGVPGVTYAHLPVVTNVQGEKLSKQTRAPALDDAKPVPALWEALAFLGQRPPAELRQGALADLWAWAKKHWDLGNVPRKRGIPLA